MPNLFKMSLDKVNIKLNLLSGRNKTNRQYFINQLYRNDGKNKFIHYFWLNMTALKVKPTSFLNKEFTLLDKKQDRYFLIVTILIFSILFLNIFKPFNINRWYSDSRFISFLRLSSYGVVVALVYLFTQFPLRKVFRQNTFSIKSFILWFLIEIVIISLIYIFLYGNPLGNFFNDFIFSLKYTLLGICLPYSFAILVIYYKKHRTEIESLQQKISHSSHSQLLVFI